MRPYVTTLAAIKAMRPCAERYRIFLAARPGLADEAPVTLESILDTNGESDARWVLVRMGLPGEIALHAFGSWCALQVLPIYEKHYPSDRRPRVAVEAAQHWCREPNAARAAAWDAARDAAWDAAWAAARDAAWAAAWAAASAAARDAARDAAWDAARDAAWAAARDAAWAAAWAAARDAQLLALRHICRGEFSALDRLGNHGCAAPAVPAPRENGEV